MPKDSQRLLTCDPAYDLILLVCYVLQIGMRVRSPYVVD